MTTALTTTVTTVSPSTTIATAPKYTYRAWSRLLPAPGSLGSGSRDGGGGVLLDWSTAWPAVTVYSPPMTGNRPEWSGSYRRFEMVNPVVAQWETGNDGDNQDRKVANQVAG